MKLSSKGPSVPVILLMVLLFCFCGCEPGKEELITGAYFNRTPGELKSFAIDPDSVRIDTFYSAITGYEPMTFAGTYENVSAFSVFKFYKISQSVLDSLEYARLFCTVNDIWKTGDSEFAVYSVYSDWSDSTRLDPDMFLPVLTDQLYVFSEQDSTLSSLVFNIPSATFRTWDEYGSFLIESTVNGAALVSLSSDNSSVPPYLQIVTHNEGVLDTTKVTSVEGSYYIKNEGLDSRQPILADGDAMGFVLSIHFPSFESPPTAINRSILTFSLKENNYRIPTGSMVVKGYQLTGKFTSYETMEINSGTAVSMTLTPGVDTYSVDVSGFIDSWFNLGNPNYGLVFKPDTISSTPNYAVIEPADSLVITYTARPEVR